MTKSHAQQTSAHPLRRLDELPSGAHGIVQQIERTGDAFHRLMAMGLCVGREVQIVRQGNPLIVRFLNARVGISGRIAKHILVESR